MLIQSKGTSVSVPVQIGPCTLEHTFYVPIGAASDCLLGNKFFGTNSYDALFAENKLRVDEITLVLMYRKQFLSDKKQIHQVVALENI